MSNYVKFKTEEVRAAAKRMIAHIEQLRKDEEEILIKKEMSRRRFSFRRLKYYYLKREEAVKLLEDRGSCFFSSFDRVRMRYGNQFDMCQSLINVCSEDGLVTLTVEDAGSLALFS